MSDIQSSPDPQRGLWDQEVQDPGLEALLEDFDSARERRAQADAECKDIKERIDESPHVQRLPKGQRLRCGRMVVLHTEFTRKEYSVKGAEAKRRNHVRPLKQGQAGLE